MKNQFRQNYVTDSGNNATSAKPFKWTKSAAAIIESVQRAKSSAGITGKN